MLFPKGWGRPPERSEPYAGRVGMAKRLMMQEEARGWSFTDQHVCKGCVADDALAAAIAAGDNANLVGRTPTP